MLRTRSRRRIAGGDATTVIELQIPLPLGAAAAAAAAGDSSESDGATTTCYICAEAFCGVDECCRSLTHLRCCTQPICAGCMVKSAKRCTCTDDCEQVIAFCPFCRMISACDSLDLFRGSCVKPCRSCRDDASAPADPPAAPAADPAA